MQIVAIIFIISLYSSCTKVASVNLNYDLTHLFSKNKDELKQDLQILKSIKTNYKNENYSKNNNNNCKNDKIGFYCAIKKYSILIKPEFNDDDNVIKYLKEIIKNDFSSRFETDIINNFSSNTNTTFKDIQFVLNKAIKSLNKELNSKSNTNIRFSIGSGIRF